MKSLIDDADADFKWRKYSRALAGYKAAFQADRKRGTMSAADRARLLQNVAIAYRQLGHTDEAETMLERAIEAAPGSASAYYQLALTESVSGRFVEALRALEQSLQSAASAAELRKTLLLARTDGELDPLRDLPDFARIIARNSARTGQTR